MNTSAPGAPRLAPGAIAEAAALLQRLWDRPERIPALPAECRPRSRTDGYRIQAQLAFFSGQAVAGWKIAATSVAGQKHIGVDGPLAGRLFAGRVLAPGACVPLAANLMRVAEAEFAFRMGRALPPRERPYGVAEVLDAVDALHPAIEIPDSRFRDFAAVGAEQLIADNACASWFVLGPAAPAPWRERDLAQHPVAAFRNGALAAEGSGANVLGDPRIALTWLANELSRFAAGLRPGDIVTTGTCVTPLAIAPGERVRADFGALGALEAAFSD